MPGTTPAILYVGGYFKSGSTITDMLFGTDPSILNTGELTQLFDVYKQDRLCGCGSYAEKITRCEFWTVVISNLRARFPRFSLSEANHITREVESFSGLLTLLQGRGSPAILTYKELWKGVVEALFETAEKPIIVDSSKSVFSWTIARAYMLSVVCELPVYYIHLVRDPRAVLWSEIRNKEVGMRERYERIVKTIINWNLSNEVVSHLKGRLFQGYMLIRYETLTTVPGEVLDSLGQSFGIDFSAVKETLAERREIPIGYSVAGNPFRLSERPVTQLRPNNSWVERLPINARLLGALSWPTACRYGYRLLS